MYKSILIPVDLSHKSSWKKTLPVAVEMARTFGADLTVSTVLPEFGLPMASVDFPPDFEQKGKANMSDALTEMVNQNVPDDISVKIVVSKGSIYSEIMKTADKLGCDLIVMSSHRPEMRDYLIGPNAARVMRHAKQSVFVVRD